jgi:hypothetical protein
MEEVEISLDGLNCYFIFIFVTNSLIGFHSGEKVKRFESFNNNIMNSNNMPEENREEFQIQQKMTAYHHRLLTPRKSCFITFVFFPFPFRLFFSLHPFHPCLLLLTCLFIAAIKVQGMQFRLFFVFVFLVCKPHHGNFINLLLLLKSAKISLNSSRLSEPCFSHQEDGKHLPVDRWVY